VTRGASPVSELIFSRHCPSPQRGLNLVLRGGPELGDPQKYVLLGGRRRGRSGRPAPGKKRAAGARKKWAVRGVSRRLRKS
jgi:hypothetical protein